MVSPQAPQLAAPATSSTAPSRGDRLDRLARRVGRPVHQQHQHGAGHGRQAGGEQDSAAIHPQLAAGCGSAEGREAETWLFRWFFRKLLASFKLHASGVQETWRINASLINCPDSLAEAPKQQDPCASRLTLMASSYD